VKNSSAVAAAAAAVAAAADDEVGGELKAESHAILVLSKSVQSR
jgi:hypothetical protein